MKIDFKKILKSFLPSQGFVVFIVVFLVLFIILASPLVLWKFFHLEISIPTNKTLTDEFTFLYYVLITTITAIIALFSYKQFQHFNENLKADYLLKIDARWGSKEIIKARAIIHHLYLISKRKLNISSEPEKNELLRKEIGNELIRLAESTNGNEPQEFLYILNFLDFMEITGYLYSNGQLSKKDLIELFGDSVQFNYEVLKPYIEHRRDVHHNKAFSKEFERLYDSLKRV